MPANDAMTVLNLFTYEAPEGKRFFEKASDTMRAYGQLELDPIHFVHAAMLDVFAPLEVQRYIERFEITIDEVDDATRSLRPEGFSVRPGKNGDMVEGATRAMKKMYESLAIRYTHFVGAPQDWNWYHQGFLVAIESVESLAVNRLLARREALV